MNLSDDMCRAVISYLSFNELVSLSLTDRKLYRLAQSTAIPCRVSVRHHYRIPNSKVKLTICPRPKEYRRKVLISDQVAVYVESYRYLTLG